MWKELVERFYPEHSFGPGAPDRSLAAAERQLGTSLPPDLRELLQESDGVSGEFGLGIVWPIERIVADNLRFRSNPDCRAAYMPFDPMLFFGDAGNGDQFAYIILQEEIRRPDIFAWNHVDDSRYWVAPSLGTYLEWWADGRIKL